MKYKLIKKYPGLSSELEVGDIAECDTKFVTVHIGTHYSTQWTKDYFENYPEFWEKVEESDFEIISFRRANPNHDKNGFRYILDQNSMYYDDENNHNIRFSLGYMLHEGSCVDTGDFIIESIKRLSDNEVFTIGDRIGLENWVDNDCFLKKITIHNEELRFHIEQDGYTAYYDNINEFLHKKTPIITTEDGVELFEDDSYWFIWLSNPSYNQTINTIYFVDHIKPVSPSASSFSPTAKFFSTEQAAKDYLKIITVVFTTEDGVNLYEDDDFWHVDSYFGITQGIVRNPFVKLKGYHEFSTKEKAQEYVDLYKPQYSMKSILDSSENFWNSTDLILLDLNKLKSKK